MTEVALDSVKFFYDQTGQPREVLMSYSLFQQIELMLKNLHKEDDTHYIWTEDWQARIKQGEADIQAGRFITVTSENIEAALEWLDD